MKLQTVIFFGRSGSGKGTQAELLLKYLKEKDPERKGIYVETGQRFRDFMGSDNYTAKHVKEVLSSGGLLPAFLPIWIWTQLLIDEMTGNEHIVLDGVSRRANEAPIIDSAMQFYGREKVYIVLLDVPREESKDRLIKRGRADDHPEKIDQRLDWYETDVVHAVNFFKEHPYYTFLNINGHQPIEKVHADLLAAMGI